MNKWMLEAHRPDYDYVTFATQTLQKVYPFIEKEVIGHSWAGREITALTIGNKKSRVLYTAATHGSEWLTALVLLRFIEDLCSHYRNKTRFSSIDMDVLFAEKGATFIPLVNPDGVQINLMGQVGQPEFDSFVKRQAYDFSQWNANARGVDINHNFDAEWSKLHEMEKKSGILGPSPRQYGGPAPESEMETYALVQYCKDNHFSTAFSLHSQGEEIYYKFMDFTPPRANLMAKVLSASSGYALVEQDGLASYGGFKDWFIKEFNRAAFTIEIGKGKNPLPLSELEPIYNTIREMLLLGMLF